MDKKSNKKEVIDDEANTSKTREEVDTFLELPVELRDTFYSNGIKILSGQYDFVLDFVELPPINNEHLEGIRIYVNPFNFKLFVKLFNEQLKIYEEQFGEIEIQ